MPETDVITEATNFLFADLATLPKLQDGQWFDGFSIGAFTDMRGREVEVKKGELQEYLDNTLAAIAATEDSNGVPAGLPIDQLNHDNGRAAGWIIDVRLDAERGVIQFKPKWTQTGIDLIEDGFMRFFSATFNPVQKVIMGGSLTNWPATRNEKEEILLKPIELSKTLTAYELDESEAGEPPEIQPNPEEQIMDEKIELTQEEREAIALEQVAELFDSSATGDLTSLIDARVAEKVKAGVAAELTRLEIESNVHQFSLSVTDGKEGYALPLKSERLEEFLLGLEVEQREEAMAIFTEIAEAGTVDFSELGHSKETKGLIELPESLRNALQRGDLTVEEVKKGNMFDASEYDFSEFENKE